MGRGLKTGRFRSWLQHSTPVAQRQTGSWPNRPIAGFLIGQDSATTDGCGQVKLQHVRIDEAVAAGCRDLGEMHCPGRA
ncbi:hypothetical protein J1614_005733 [Plenodomus biglobosus]|nr:hypothetical protein J1614_005733 [Plenodomus biglobosus]